THGLQVRVSSERLEGRRLKKTTGSTGQGCEMVDVGFILVLVFGIAAFRAGTTAASNSDSTKKSGRTINALLTIASLGVVAYQLYAFNAIYNTPGLEFTALDVAVGGIMVVLLLEASRRTIGPAIPILGILAIFYLRYGQ